jgi:cyclomaltodextrinase
MHHPGPPRFVATGEEIELAPRDPDPTATYRWRLVQKPDAAAVALGDDPVEHLTPDAPGRYVARLSAPDGEHDQTVRVFPGSLAPGSSGACSSGQSGDGRTDSWRRSDRGGPGRSGSARTDDDAATGEDPGRPRVALSAAREDDEVLVRADPDPNPRGNERASDLDVAFELDDRDPLSRADLAVSDRELVVPLDRLTGRVRVYAVAVGSGGYSVPDAVEIDPAAADPVADGGPSGTGADSGPAIGPGTRPDGGTAVESGSATLSDDVYVSRPFEPPDWAEDAVIYEVYVRTFGGDETPDGDAFDAVIDRLDYVEALGVDTLWLTPVLENDHAPHGYNVTDFFAIADDLGSREDYRRLVAAAHDRGIKVLFDLVANHSARSHPYFRDAVDDPDSEYRDWYEWRTDTEPETYFDWEHIANFDFDHLPVRRHLLDAVDEWAPLVDGFRCDMAWAVPNGFWREVHDRVKERDAEFLLLDETIPYIPDFQAGLFDEHFDSTTYAALRRVGRGEAPAGDVLDAIDERAEVGFPEYAGFMLYAENHDEARYLAECGRPAARAALGALFTLPGSPMVYAGQEFAQLGKRDALVWAEADEELVGFVRSLAAVRSDEPALTADAGLVRVDYDVRSGPADRVVAYGRDPPASGPVVVVLNFGEETATVECDAVAGETDVVSGASVTGADGLAVEDVVVLPATDEAFGS